MSRTKLNTALQELLTDQILDGLVEGAVDNIIEKLTNKLEKKLCEKTSEIKIPSILSGEELLSSKVKLINFKKNRLVVAIESAPTARTIKLGHFKTINLPFPYIYFILLFNKKSNNFIFNSLRVGFRNSPVHDTDDMLCIPPLPNFISGNYDGLRVCLGEGLNVGSTTIIKQIEEVISYFWLSSFDCTNHYLRNYLSFHHWASLSKENVLKVEWRAGISLKELTNKLVNNLLATDYEDRMNSSWLKQEINKQLPIDVTKEIKKLCKKIVTALAREIKLNKDAVIKEI